MFDGAPDMKAWLFEQWLDYLIAAVCLVVVAMADNSTLQLTAFAGCVVVVASFVARVLNRAYTRYVLTDYRVIRACGVLRRDHEWIAWRKVTDVSVQRSMSDRLFGTATVQIHSANEASGFKEMTDVPRPVEFAEMIVELVNGHQGSVVESARD